MNHTNCRILYNCLLQTHIPDNFHNDYNMNFYENEITWSDRNAASFSNVDIYNDKVNTVRFFKELTKYNLFKYLPYQLKQYSRIETANFDSCKVEQEESYFEWGDNIAYENIKNNGLEKIDQNYFQFLHIEGGHVPYDYDENVTKYLETQKRISNKYLYGNRY